MSKKYLAERVVNLKPSGIRKFFDIVATMDDVISLGIGEPDFDTPQSILRAGIAGLKRYDISYDPTTEVIATVGVSEALYLAMTAIIEQGDEIIIPTPCFVSYQAEEVFRLKFPTEWRMLSSQIRLK